MLFLWKFSRTKTNEDKKYAKERMKELLPRQPKPQKQPWHDSTNHNYEFEKDIKRLPTCQLSNNQIYRVNLLPRSYQEEVDRKLHTNGFKMAGNTAKEFPLPGQHLLAKEGRERL